MTPGSGPVRAIGGAIAGLLYGSVLSVLSIGAAGGGHGTLIALFLSAAPLGIFYIADTQTAREAAFYASIYGAPLLWAAFGLLAALPRDGKGLVRILLLLHYASGLALVTITGERLMGGSGQLPEVFLMWAPVYLVGQVALWWQISGPRQARPTA